MTRRAAWELVFGALVWVVAAAPIWWSPGLVTGYDRGEADNHRWMLWQAAHPGTAWTNLPDGSGIPLVDPVHLPVFAAGLLVGPSFAWNLVLGVDLAIAVLGGAYLAARATGRRDLAPIGMILALAPPLQGVVAFGLSEAWTLGWLAIFLGGWLGFLRDGRRGDGVAAAVGLGAYLLSGGYAWFFGAISVLFALGWAPARGRRLPALAILGFGALCAAPAVAAFWHARGVWSGRLVPIVSWAVLSGWREQPEGGTDLLALLLPRLPVASGRSTYLGLVPVLLAIPGVPRARWPAVAVAAFLVLSLGTVMRVAGHPIAPGPAMLLHDAGFHWVHHWYRATGPLVVWMIPLVAHGVAWLSEGRRVSAAAIAALAGLEAVTIGGNPWPIAQYDASPPPGIAELRGAGGLLVLPWDVRDEFAAGIPRPFERWGPALERPLAVAYEGPLVLRERVRLAASLDRACSTAPDDRPFSDPGTLTPDIVEAGRRQLVRAGVTEIAVWTGRAPGPGFCRDVAVRALGPPDREVAGVLSWRLRP